ncbi:hypothetical protein GCM10025773_28730 [Microbacterium jejuense]
MLVATSAVIPVVSVPTGFAPGDLPSYVAALASYVGRAAVVIPGHGTLANAGMDEAYERLKRLVSTGA